jgi:hypothetical protein
MPTRRTLIRGQKVKVNNFRGVLMDGKKFGLLAFILSTSVLLILLVFSTAIVLAAPTIDNYPGGILENIQGGTFTLHHTFTFNQAASGFYTIAIYWEYTADDNNFTLDNYRAYWDNGDWVECTLSNDIDNGSLHSQVFQNLVGETMNGSFNVDLRYLMKGPLGALHIVADNHPLHYTSIDIRETAINTIYPDDVTIKVDAATKGVNVSISPSSQSGANGATLTYTVTVNNTGNVSDNYSLTVTDNAGWSPSILPTSLTVSAWSDGTSTLSVTVPSGAVGGTIDSITVIARGTVYENSATCTATATKATAPPAPSGGVSPVIYVGVAVVIVVIIAAILILKPF